MKFKDNRAIYLQIAQHFLENILQHKWMPGEKIPSIRDIAVTYEVNPNTTMRTFTYLQDKGIIYNKRGIGYYVAEDGFEKTLTLKKEEFITEELPAFFNTMKLLGITVSDLQSYHAEFEKQS